MKEEAVGVVANRSFPPLLGYNHDPTGHFTGLARENLMLDATADQFLLRDLCCVSVTCLIWP